MDEPFGAVDAIERAHLQDEVAALHAQVRKTVVFVTHDVDEALRLADSIVVMRSGKVEQLGRPLELMAHPANDFVSQLMDAPDIVRRFGVMKVASAMRRVGDSVDIKSTAPAVLATDSLRVALSKMLVFGGDEIGVIDASGKIVGVLSWGDFRGAARAQ
jgi:osmoprotectant transport system ATP-binding protein